MSIESDLEEIFADLAAATTEGRTKMDRYREFREVFLGTEVGKRVLYDIMAISKFYLPPRTDDPHKLARVIGKKDLAGEILFTTYREPKTAPTKQVRKDEDG